MLARGRSIRNVKEARQNTAAATVTWQNTVGATVTWFSGGFQINNYPLNSQSKYWGQNITATAAAWVITAFNYQYDVGSEW